MDFNALPDHPNNVLRSHAAGLYHELKDVVGLDRAVVENRADGYGRAATLLMAYQLEHDVTFVALDNDTLDELIRTYRTHDDDGELDRWHALDELLSDLLGLDS